MKNEGINTFNLTYFLPPYEWYNDSISAWTNHPGMQLINFIPGTKNTADYTWPGLKNYKGSEEIYTSVIQYREKPPLA